MKSLLLRLTLSIYIKRGRSHRSSNKNKNFCPTLHPVTYITGEILINMDHGLVTGSVFIDRAKVFDTGDRDILLSKFEYYGESLPWLRTSSREESSRCTLILSHLKSLP